MTVLYDTSFTLIYTEKTERREGRQQRNTPLDTMHCTSYNCCEKASKQTKYRATALIFQGGGKSWVLLLVESLKLNSTFKHRTDLIFILFQPIFLVMNVHFPQINLDPYAATNAGYYMYLMVCDRVNLLP